MSLAITNYASREDWLASRSETIGASEIAAVLGRSPWKSPYALWAEKTGRVLPSGDETRRQRLGLRLEPVVASEYEFETGRKLIDHGQFAIVRSKTHPFLSATLDREIAPIDDRGPGVLDLKTAILFKANEWDEMPPLDYQIQVQAQMVVTGYGWGSLAVLIGNHDFKWADVPRNDRFIAFMVKKCAEFMELVRTDTPPSIDSHKSTREALAEIYPEEAGTTVELPPQAFEWAEQIAQAKAMEAEARELRIGAENQVKAALGKASHGIMRDGSSFTYRTVNRRSYVVEETSYRALKFHKGESR